MTQAIDMIYFNEPLRFNLQSYQHVMDSKAKTLIEVFENLRDAAYKYLVMPAAREKAYEQNLKQSYRENKETLIEIASE